MNKWILLSIIMFYTSLVWANEKVSMALQEYAWEKRQLIVFSPSKQEPNYQIFLRVQSEFLEEFKDRKLHTWHVIEGEKVKLDVQIRTDLKNSDFHEAYGVSGEKFRVILIGYDQQEKLRQDKFQIDYLFAEIDQMPMRIQEMQEN